MLRYADRSQGGSDGPGSHFPKGPGRFPQWNPPGEYLEPSQSQENDQFLCLRLRAPKLERVVSLTERALLNPWVLRLIFPSNAALQPVENVQSVDWEDLDENRKSAGDWHWITKPIRVPLRVVVVSLIGRTISPLGVLFYGAMTAVKVADYHFAKLADVEEKQTHLDEKWLRVEAYANAFFTDLTSFWFLGGASHLFEEGWSSLFQKKALSVKSAALLVLSGIFLGSFGSAYEPMVALLVARREERSSMARHLALWNHLGLSDKDGNPLPFDATDYLQPNS